MNKISKLTFSLRSILLIGVTCASTVASAAEPSTDPNLQNAAQDSLVLDSDPNASKYPGAVELFENYNQALASGELDESFRVNAPTLPLLRSVYDYLTERQMSPEQLRNLGGVNKNPLGLSLGGVKKDPLALSKAHESCSDQVTLCLSESGAALVGGFEIWDILRIAVCATTAIKDGETIPNLTAECAQIMGEGGDTCAKANDLCGIVSHGRTSVTAFKGSTSNYSQTKTCGNVGAAHDRVVQFGASWGNVSNKQRIINLQLTCSNGNFVTVGGLRYPATYSYAKKNCPMNASDQKIGEGVGVWGLGGSFNKIRMRCDYPFNESSANDTWTQNLGVNASTDDDDGSYKTTYCPEGKHIWGATTHTNRDPEEVNSYIVGFNLICR
jgi:hypothetical protein